MWYLEAYDNESDFLVGSYLLRNATSATIRELVKIGDEGTPIEAAMHEIPTADVEKFTKYIEGEFTMDPNCTYFVGFFAD